jgi:AcrR family transcriptional regulator
LNRRVHATLDGMPRGPRRLDHRAASAVLAQGPTVTMSEVATQLGVAKPTLYRLAGSKEQLVRECVDAEAERLLDFLHGALADTEGASGLDMATAGLRAVERYADDSPGGFRLLFERRGPEAQDAVTRLEIRLAEMLRRNALQAGRSPRHTDLLGSALLGATVAIVSRALADGTPVDAEAVAGDFAAALESRDPQAAR